MTVPHNKPSPAEKPPRAVWVAFLDKLVVVMLEFEHVQKVITEGKAMEGPYTLFWMVSFISYVIAFPTTVFCMWFITRGSLPAIASTAIVVSALLGLWVPYLCAWGMLAIIGSTCALTVWFGVSLLPMPVSQAVNSDTIFSSYSDKVRSLPASVRLFMFLIYLGSLWMGYTLLMSHYLPDLWLLYAANLVISMYLCGSAIHFVTKPIEHSV